MLPMSNVIVENDPSFLGLKHAYALHAEKYAPLILLVHGRAGNMNVMLTFRRITPETQCSFVSVEAPESDSLGGFSWWQVDNGKLLRDNAIPASLRLISFIKKFIALHALKPSCIIALGFSQGGAVLSVAAQQEPQLLKGVGLLASFVVKLEETALNQMQAPAFFIAHGTLDETVPLARAEEGAEWLRMRGFKVQLVLDEVGHKVGTTAMRGLKTWLINLIGE